MMSYVRLRRRDPVEIAVSPTALPKVWRNITGFDNLPAEEQARHGWYPFETSTRPEVEPNTHKVVQHLALDRGVVRATWEVVDLTDAERIHRRAERRREILSQLPAVRFRHETDGIVFDGIPLHTDRESQATITLSAMQGVAERWKGADGKWYNMDPERLQAAAQAVMRHKRACFAREEALAKALHEADSPEALDAIDLEEGWP